MPSHEEILSGVSEVLLKALAPNLDVENIHGDSTLASLGAEPIDYLDILFGLTNRFGIAIHDGEFLPTNDEMSTAGIAKAAKDGRFTAEGLLEIGRRFPFAEVSVLLDNPAVNRFFSIYTVEAVVRFVTAKCSKEEVVLTPSS